MTSPLHIVSLPPSRSPTPTGPTVLDKSALDKRVKKNGTVYTFDFKHINLDSDEFSELVRDRRHFLSHPVIEAYISAKWTNIRKFYIINFWVFFFLLAAFTVLIGFGSLKMEGN